MCAARVDDYFELLGQSSDEGPAGTDDDPAMDAINALIDAILFYKVRPDFHLPVCLYHTNCDTVLACLSLWRGWRFAEGG